MDWQSSESKLRDRQMIKDEIAALYGFIERTRNMFYVAIVALLTSFSFMDLDAAVYVIPYLIIIPIYLITLDYMDGINELGSYIKVFIESQGTGYESRIFAAYGVGTASKSFNALRGSYHIPFLSSNLVSFGLFLTQKDVNLLRLGDVDWTSWGAVDISVVVAFVLVWCIYAWLGRYVAKSRTRYEEIWHQVKKGEDVEAAKRKARKRIAIIKIK